MSLILISSERFARHTTPPGHPESAARARVMNAIVEGWRESGGGVAAPAPATREQLARVHDQAHIERVQATAGSAAAFDADTYAASESAEIAELAAGAAVAAVERVLSGPDRRALALVRPPGHHAERNRAMGFCLYNNVAVAAAHARALGCGRVAIVDYDVHHGNGTQHIFEADASVLYVSTHQFPFYPGTGAAEEVGLAPAAGLTVNLPLEAGATDADYHLVFSTVVTPILKQFKPDLLLVSAGFDAHARDPLGGMRLTTDSFRAMTRELVEVAEKSCGGRIVLVTEGGYDLAALGDSLRAAIEALAAPGAATAEWPVSTAEPRRARAAISAARQALSGFWAI